MATTDHPSQPPLPSVPSRRLLLQGGVLAGAGLAAVVSRPGAARAAAPCTTGIKAILESLLAAERASMALYYTALTTRAVVGHPYLAGTSADPNHVASNGSRVNVACLQAALDQERQHAAILTQHGAGAVAPKSIPLQFYFPATTFASLGYTSLPHTFLGVLDHLETTVIGLYLSAISRFAVAKRADLALLATRMLGPECQHRAIGRVIAGDTPANNMALQVGQFSCPDDAAAAFSRYLTGHGFDTEATAPISLPQDAAITAIIGKNSSR